MPYPSSSAANSRENLCRLTAREAVRLVASGSISIEALTRSYLDRIDQIDPAVLAWSYLDADAALAQAKRLDNTSAGRLKGLVFGVKDVIDTADMPTCYGSAAYAGHHPGRDASAVAIARAEGGLLLGKTVTTEFAATSPGKTRNPHHPAHTPGGSSSGSAAAVASFMTPLALGTQTAGSTIRPASFCGVVGYKPSYGLIDPTGVKTLVRAFDTLGIFARDVQDAAFFAAVLSGVVDLQDPEPLPRLRIGVFRTELWDLAGPATRDAMQHTISALKKAGIAVAEIDAGGGFRGLDRLFGEIFDWGITTGLAHERLAMADRLTAKTLAMLDEAARRASAKAWQAAQAQVSRQSKGFENLFAGYDALLTPAAIGEAPLGLDSTGDASFNRIWTMLHMPCICVPVKTGPAGLPVGVQLVGRRNNDAVTLSAAVTLEAALAAYC